MIFDLARGRSDSLNVVARKVPSKQGMMERMESSGEILPSSSTPAGPVSLFSVCQS